MINDKRSSEILEECLNLIFTGQETVESALALYPEYADKLRPELEAALWLHRRRSVTGIRPGYVAASRQRLVSQIKQGDQSARLGKKPILGWRPVVFRLAFVALFLIVAGFTFNGGVQAINASLPGDRLYDLKLATEDVQLSLISDPAEEVAFRIELVDRRAKEVESLLEMERYEDAEVALASYRENVAIARDLVTNLSDRENQNTLAQKLANTISQNNESFAIVMATSGMPNDIVIVMSTTISLNDEVTFAMLTVLGVNDIILEQPTEVPAASMTPTFTSTPTSTFTSTSTATDTPTATSTATLEASETPVATDTIVVTATLEPSNTPRPPAPTDDGGGDPEPEPTQKPTKTPRPPRPTKTPKDK